MTDTVGAEFGALEDHGERTDRKGPLDPWERRLRLALFHLPVVLAEQDLHLRYRWVRDPLGALDRSLLGRTDHDVFDDRRDADHVAALKRRVLQTGTPSRHHLQARLGGRDRVYDLTIAPLHDGPAGPLIGVETASLDITGRTELEQALRESEASARRAAAARDELLGIVSHDMRNPLYAVAIAGANLERVLEGSEVHEVATPILRNMRQSLGELQHLIRDLLDVSRLEGGPLYVERQRVSAALVLHEVRQRYGPIAEDRGIVLTVGDTTALPPIHADLPRLLRVFSNLIGNAVQFTPRGGLIAVWATDEGPRVRFSVSDTGPGMTPTEARMVFDRFWQARHHGRSGIGLGLTIAKAIVEAHDGAISVETEPGHGTTFAFTVPSWPPDDAEG